MTVYLPTLHVCFFVRTIFCRYQTDWKGETPSRTGTLPRVMWATDSGVLIFWQPMKPTEETPLDIQDERPFDFLWIDREVFRASPNGQTWAALLQPTCLSIYACLCQHASTQKGKPRQSYPSYATIAREAGISRRAAIDGVAKLLKFGFIRQGERTALRTNVFIITSKDKWCVAADGRKSRSDKGSPHKIANNIHHSKNTEIVNSIHHDSEYDSPLIVNSIHPDSEYHSPEVKSVSKVIEEKSGSSSSSSKSSPPREQKTEDEEGTSVSFSLSSSLLTPEQVRKIQEFYLLGRDEVEGFLIRNETSFEELSKCLDVIRDASESLGGTIYKDFSKRPIQRPLGFIFKNGWIVRGRACPPSLHAPEIKKERNRWNNQDINDMELEKTRQRLRAKGVAV